MKTYFRHFRFSMFGVALLCLILGAAFMLFPDTTQKVFCYAFGAVLLLCGIFQIASYIVGTNKNLLAKLMFAGGVVACVAGAAILLQPNQEIIWKLTLIVIGVSSWRIASMTCASTGSSITGSSAVTNIEPLRHS